MPSDKPVPTCLASDSHRRLRVERSAFYQAVRDHVEAYHVETCYQAVEDAFVARLPAGQLTEAPR